MNEEGGSRGGQILTDGEAKRRGVMGEKPRIRGPFHVHKITFKMICLLNIKKIQMDRKGSTSDLHEKHLVQSIQSFISQNEAKCSKWKKICKH